MNRREHRWKNCPTGKPEDVKIFLHGTPWGELIGENITVGVVGFGYSVNEAMKELVAEMDHYHRNWIELAEEE